MIALRLLVVAAFVVAVPSALASRNVSSSPVQQATASVLASDATETGPLSIRVLSNRADLISGGDALVQIVMPDKATKLLLRPTITIGTRDVSGAFAWRPDGRYLGLVEGLAVGKNVLTASLQSSTVRITITNQRIGGPVFAGPQVQPWFCTTADNGLGPAKTGPPMRWFVMVIRTVEDWSVAATTFLPTASSSTSPR
jgi:hypothetical protein